MIGIGTKVLLFRSRDKTWLEENKKSTSVDNRGLLVHDKDGNFFLKETVISVDDKARLFNIDGQNYLRGEARKLQETGTYKLARFFFTRYDLSSYAHWGQAYHTLNYATGYVLPDDIVYSQGLLFRVTATHGYQEYNPKTVYRFNEHIIGDNLIIASNLYATAIETEAAWLCVSMYDHSRPERPYIDLEYWRYWYWDDDWNYEEKRIGYVRWYPSSSQTIPEINNPLCGNGDVILASARWMGDIWHPYYDSKIRFAITFPGAIAMKNLWESWL